MTGVQHEPGKISPFAKISDGFPGASVREIKEFCANAYDLELVDVSELGGEIDQNLRVTCADGDTCVVKVLRDGADPVDAEWRTDLLEHLAERVPQLSVPAVRHTLDGDSIGQLRRGDRTNYVLVLSWLPGRLLSALDRRSPQLLRDIGATAATFNVALQDFPPPPSSSSHHWDLTRADESVLSCLPHIRDEARAELLMATMRRYDRIRPSIDGLPRSVVHNDLNDFNIIVAPDGQRRHQVTGVIDVGDAMHTVRIAELAVAVAYSMLGAPDPLRAAHLVVSGYAERLAITPEEIALIFPLATSRLCVNAATWTRRSTPEDIATDYGQTRVRHTWALLERLRSVPDALAEAVLRHAANLEPCAGGASAQRMVADLAVPTAIAVSGHLEPDPGRDPEQANSDAEPTTLDLGVAVEPLGSTSFDSPLAGVVERVDEDLREVVVRHEHSGFAVWSVWRGAVPAVSEGDGVAAGDPVAAVPEGTGADRPVRFAFVADAGLAGNLPARVQPWLRPVWQSLCPDPVAALVQTRGPWAADARRAVEARVAHTGRAQNHYFREPMTVVASDGVWLVDSDGMAYLDAINNVTHVGHVDPTVRDAVVRQVGRLNTNSRFVYPQFGLYAERLAALLPDPLEVVYFVCTGSEANDLALRMVRQVTGRRDVMVVDGAYHGNTTAVLEISPDRYDGPGGGGRPATTYAVPQPNRYRGPYGYDDPAAGAKYAGMVADAVRELVADGRPPAAFFTEALVGSGGQITLPLGYLAAAFSAVRAAGGLCVSDEVQIGIGRLGTMWGFEAHGVVPDIVTLGKPLGNGMPIAAVITTRAIAAEFDRGMRYFNTFAGNPVSCAAGIAVLDVIERDGLVAKAGQTGRALLSRLHDLQRGHELIGDVRGEGMYAGIELVRDQTTKEPASTEALHVSERMRGCGVLIYPNGPHGNVLKIKPPLVFGESDVAVLVETLDAVLGEDW